MLCPKLAFGSLIRKSQDMPSASRRTRKACGAIRSEYEGLRIGVIKVGGGGDSQILV